MTPSYLSNFLKSNIFEFLNTNSIAKPTLKPFDFKKLNLKSFDFKKMISKIDFSQILFKNLDDFHTFRDYQWLAKKDPSKELLCVKVDFANGSRVEKLTTVKRVDLTCWNLFLRFLGWGKLAGLDYELSRVAIFVGEMFRDRSQNFIRIPADSPAIKNIQNIYDRIKPSAARDTLQALLDFIAQPEEVEEDLAERVSEEIELKEECSEIDIE